MGTLMDHTPGEPALLLERLRTGGHGGLAALFGRHRDRLRRMVELRMDPRLQARLDPSDVLQEAYLEVARDLDAYLRDPRLTPFLWLRLHVARRPARGGRGGAGAGWSAAGRHGAATRRRG